MAPHAPITLTTAEDVVLAGPLMLGYWPASSICAIFVDDAQRVVLIMRWDQDAPVAPPALDRVATADARIDAVHLVAFLSGEDVDIAPWLEAADELVSAGARPGEFLLTGLAGRDVAWTRALEQGQEASVRVIAHAEVLQRSQMWGLPMWQAHRDDYVADVAPREDVAARVRSLLDAAETVSEGRRDAAIADVRAALDCDDLRDEDIATVGAALTDVQVRDTVLWDLMQEQPDSWGAMADRLAVIVASMPESHVPAPATLLAIVRWQMGDGSRAAAAVSRALAAETDYTLAALVERCLSTGMHPAVWRSGLATLSRSECRRAA